MELTIRVSPEEAEVTVEKKINGVIARKTVSEEQLFSSILDSRQINEVHPTGLLPLGCIAATLNQNHTWYFIRYPELYADITYMDTEYPHFPLPRLVFGIQYLPREQKVALTALCVVKDERLTPDTPLYRYPFSNVGGGDLICLGNNALPVYKDPTRLHTLTAFILRLPNNNDYYSADNNRMKAEYRDLLELMKGREPAAYYTDVLVESGRTLKDFMNRS